MYQTRLSRLEVADARWLQGNGRYKVEVTISAKTMGPQTGRQLALQVLQPTGNHGRHLRGRVASRSEIPRSPSRDNSETIPRQVKPPRVSDTWKGSTTRPRVPLTPAAGHVKRACLGHGQVRRRFRASSSMQCSQKPAPRPVSNRKRKEEQFGYPNCCKIKGRRNQAHYRTVVCRH